jgi:CRISPR-associated protein Csm1
MYIQQLVEGRLRGLDAFLASGAGEGPLSLLGQARWAALLSPVLPRALLRELQLPPELLGMGGGGEFLVLVPGEHRDRAADFLSSAADLISAHSGRLLKLEWAFTEALGDWSDIRKRLHEELTHRARTPARGPDTFAPAPAAAVSSAYFHQFAIELHGAVHVGWSATAPGGFTFEPHFHLRDDLDFPRHSAPDEADAGPASPTDLARRARGQPAWAILRAEVDLYSMRLRRVTSDREHLQLSIAYQQFFAHELEMLCVQPDYWRVVTLLHAGPSGFAVGGSWDAALSFAREFQRLFDRFAGANLRELPGAEGKTLSAGIAVAGPEESATDVYGTAYEQLRLAQSAGKNCVSLFGQPLDWQQLAGAAELQSLLTQLVSEYQVDPAAIRELQSLYRESQSTHLTRRRIRVDRPWRYHRLIEKVIAGKPGKEFRQLRQSVIQNLTGRQPTQVKLHPSGRTALAWARLATSPSGPLEPVTVQPEATVPPETNRPENE